MSSARALTAAVDALVPSTPTKYRGEAPEGSAMPYTVANHHVPEVLERSEGGSVTGQVGRVLITAAGKTEESVLATLDTVIPALEGQVVTVTGWSTSPLRRVGQTRIYPDWTVTLTGGNHPIVGVAEFTYAVTETA